jgi:nucleoside-diphosphate-sugar epimerase
LKVLVTGATGFLGWRTATLLAERGHEVIALARPGGARRRAAEELETVTVDAGDPTARDLLAGCDAVFHFAGVPDPARARADPAGAVLANVGTTLNLLEGCAEQGAGLIYPSTVRAAGARPPDPYALSKRLGEEACRLHGARATVVRLTSVFGPGQVAWEGATGAIANFAARALAGEPITIPGNPERVRDFLFVDDLAPALEEIVTGGRWDETLTLASGHVTPLRRAAELVIGSASSGSPIVTPGGNLPPGENESYEPDRGAPRLDLAARPLEEGIKLYVDWLSRHPAAESRTRA